MAMTGLLAFVMPASATAVIQIDQTAFTAGAGLITFSEFPDGTNNPTYSPAQYGGGAGSPTVTFGGYFNGQSIGSPSTCPAGAAVTGCVLGNPTGGSLSLDPNSPTTFIADDGAMPTTPILSGSPLYNGPIAINFSTPQTGVGLIGGYFNSVASTAITVYDPSGNVIGSLANDQIGDEFLGLVTTDGSADIGGLLFHLVGDEPAGFDVDNIEFGVGAQVVVPGQPVAVPEPATLSLLGLGTLAAGLARRKVRRAQPLLGQAA